MGRVVEENGVIYLTKWQIERLAKGSCITIRRHNEAIKIRPAFGSKKALKYKRLVDKYSKLLKQEVRKA